MINDEIIDYISHELSHGASEIEIRRALLAVGWNEADINENLGAAHQRHAVTPISHERETSEKRTFLKKHTRAIVALSVGTLLLAASAFAYKFLAPTPENILRDAALNMQKARSFEFSGRITADVEDNEILNLQALLPKELLNQLSDSRIAGASTSLQVALDFSGTVDSSEEKNPKGEIDLDISAGIFNVGLKAKVVDNVLYVNLDQIPEISEEITKYRDTWIRIDPSAISKEYGLGIDFTNNQPNLTPGQKEQISNLTKSTKFYSSVIELPRDVIDGMNMYRYALVLDKPVIKNYLEQVDQINKSAGGLSNSAINELDNLSFKDIEVWIGKSDKMLHRLSLTISQVASSDSLPAGSLHILMNYSNYNNTSKIEVPTNAKDIEDVINEVKANTQAKVPVAR